VRRFGAAAFFGAALLRTRGRRDVFSEDSAACEVAWLAKAARSVRRSVSTYLSTAAREILSLRAMSSFDSSSIMHNMIRRSRIENWLPCPEAPN
jgi:hypothetical protein